MPPCPSRLKWGRRSVSAASSFGRLFWEPAMPRLVSRKTWMFLLTAFLASFLVQEALRVAAPAVAFAQQPDENPAAGADAPPAQAAPGAPADESQAKPQKS